VAKRFGELVRRGVTLVGILGQSPPDHGPQGRWDRRVDALERSWVLGDDAAQRLGNRTGQERFLTTDGGVEDTAGGEDVGPRVDRRPRGLLGRHVGRRADHHADTGLRHGLQRVLVLWFVVRGQEPGQPEVQDLHATVGQDHQIRRLDVPVNDALCVRRRQRFRELDAEVDDLFGGQRTTQDLLLQRFSVDQLGDEVQRPVLGLSGLEDGGDAGMVDRRGGLGLAQKTSPGPAILDPFLADQLQGDVALEQGVAGTVDDPHGTRAQAFDHLEVGDSLWRIIHGQALSGGFYLDPGPGRIMNP
jgi:hypothetical protein